VANDGSGGWAANSSNGSGTSGNSGVVIVSWSTSSYSGTPTITGTYTSGTNGSKKWVQWTSSGTITF
jgi:hypothetical protein